MFVNILFRRSVCELAQHHHILAYYDTDSWLFAGSNNCTVYMTLGPTEGLESNTAA